MSLAMGAHGTARERRREAAHTLSFMNDDASNSTSEPLDGARVADPAGAPRDIPVRAPSRLRRILRTTLVVVAALAVTGLAAGLWIWNDPATAFRLAMTAGHANAGVSERFVEIDGHRWRALDTHPPVGGASPASGLRPARTCLVLHGLGTSAEAMMGVAPILRRTHRVVIPDLPGFGEHAMHGDVPHDWRFYIDAIERFRAHEGLGEVDVVGTSMGGAFAAAYAATYPDSVRKIVLLSPAGVVAPRQNDFMARVAAGELPLDIKDDASFDEVLRLNFPSPPPMPEPIRRAFVARAVERRDAFLRIVEDLRAFLVSGCEELMPKIKAPTLVLYGELDLLTDPSMMAVWRLGLSDMDGEVLPDAGHVLLYDKGREVSERMRRHLE
jgi:abhydrolase domain-containing protein 6